MKRGEMNMRNIVLAATCMLAVVGCARNAGEVESEIHSGGEIEVRMTPPMASDGKTVYTILLGADATEAEKHAADELAYFLSRMTGAKFPVVTEPISSAGPFILVGPSVKLKEIEPGLNTASLGGEEYVIRTKDRDLILAGGRPRGTLYAVYGLLEDHMGCRWFAPGVDRIPHRKTLELPFLDEQVKPKLEYRESFWFTGFDGDWAARNRTNGHRPLLTDRHGGKTVYKGFVHTFYNLVPPAEFAATHPEYYSEIGGKRVWGNNQLCLTSEEVLNLVVERVRKWMKETPDATIISVSQNDCHGRCECAKCKALEQAEGSPSGPLLHFVNKVAERLEPEFPDLAIDTLAYQYTRKPPLNVKPRKNVIVRLCSIECSFAQPLEGEKNAKFGDDIRGWSKICDRLYVWDYTTTFSHYILPFPNLRVLKPNLVFFVENGVKGVFEQGNYHSTGGEFEELKAWMLAKLLWNPYQDDDALLNEFLKGYYGAAAPHIRDYIDMLHDKVGELNCNTPIWADPNAPYLTSETIAKAEEFFDKAEQSVAADSDLLLRVKTARLPVYYVMLCRGKGLRPLPGQWEPSLSGVALYEYFVKTAKEAGVTHLREGGDFDACVAALKPMPRRDAPPPAECAGLKPEQWVEIQDDMFSIAQDGIWGSRVADDAASDGVAVRMPCDHKEWAVQCRLAGLPQLHGKKWRVYVSIRARKTGNDGDAFTFGWWDSEARTGKNNAVKSAELKDGYQTYLLDIFAPNENVYLWAAPAANTGNVPEIWVDRFWAVAEKE